MSESVFEIHDWTLSVDDNMLCRPDREVYLEPRLVNLLRFLAHNAGTVFGRDALINEVWDGAEVTDQVVTQSIFELRKILKDGRTDATDYIVTVPKRGYKLVAPVRPLQVVSVVMADEQPSPAVNTTLSDNPTLSDLSPPAALQDDDAQPNVAPFPAGPLTRAISTHAKDARSRWKMVSFDIFVAIVLIAIVSMLSYQHTSPQVHAMLDPNLLVFRFHSGMDDNNEKRAPRRWHYPSPYGGGGRGYAAAGAVRCYHSDGGHHARQGAECAGHPASPVAPISIWSIAISIPTGCCSAISTSSVRHSVHGVLQASSQDLLRALDQPDAEPGMGWPTDDASLMAMMEAQYYINSRDPVALKRGYRSAGAGADCPSGSAAAAGGALSGGRGAGHPGGQIRERAAAGDWHSSRQRGAKQRRSPCSGVGGVDPGRRSSTASNSRPTICWRRRRVAAARCSTTYCRASWRSWTAVPRLRVMPTVRPS